MAAQAAHRIAHVTWKYATSIDGRSAAADGSSQWITSEAAARPASPAPRRRHCRRHRHGAHRRSGADRPAGDGTLAGASRCGSGRQARNPFGGTSSQRRFAHHGDPHP
ncbi:ribD C-terminal domain protein [Mycobacterium xenopi 4042]|uniref:RibD C-terminal domain protein n=1 Tax=Mycobacterium xenopi 4042 TaxID=1299334 RepID=X7ZIW3_MYCXE|nr:ribD C-terminal domain protein [Mycobacterium xenopi 4042]